MSNIEMIWEEYHQKILRYIQSRVSDSTISEDILQDVMIKVYLNIDTLKDKRKIEGWIYKIAQNIVIDYYRNKRIDCRYAESVYYNHKQINESVKDRVPCIERMIHSLPAKYKVVVDLTVNKGMRQKEVGKQLGLSFPGAKSRIQRARKKLKDLLTECCSFKYDRFGNVIDYEPKEIVSSIDDTMY